MKNTLPVFPKFLRLPWRIVWLILLACSLWATPTLAQTIRYVKVDGTGDGTSWANASSDLQAMIDVVGVDEVWVAKGTYKPTAILKEGDNRSVRFEMKEGVKIYGGFPLGSPTWTERDPAANETVLSGDIDGNGELSGNSYHVISNSTELTAAAVLDGFTITGGNANGDKDVNFFYTKGGGMLNGGRASPTVSNCLFENNAAATPSGSGGGMYNYKFSNPTVINCSFQTNTASNSGGGMSNFSGSPTLINCSFLNNSAPKGGGMYNYGSSVL